MAGSVYFTQADLEERFPPQHVRAVFCDDGSGVPGPRLARACEVASRLVDSYLLRAWPLASIETIVAEDAAVKDAGCDLVMWAGVKGKPEWSGEGAPYAALRRDALANLEAIAKAQQRSAAEPTVGANPLTSGDVRSPQDPQYLFAPSRSRPRPGGY